MNELRRNILTFLLLLTFGTAENSQFTQNEIIARFDQGLTRFDIEIILLDQPLEIVRQVSRPLNVWLLRSIAAPNQLAKVNQEVKEIPDVHYAQNNHVVKPRLIPNDPQYVLQWSLHNTGYDTSGNPWGTEDADIDAPEAWEITTGGNTVTGHEIVVGVVDDGCDLLHMDLQSNLWTNTEEIPDNGLDDDGNGWVDDVNGWNSVGHNDSIPETSHGSEAAGVIGAQGNNASQISGVNWDVKMMIVAAFENVATTASVLEAYSYILEQKLTWIESGGTLGAFVVAVNSSFGIDSADCESGDYPIWNDMYDALGEAGILSIAATTNINANVDLIGDVPTSCSSPYLVTVTNTTQSDLKFSPAGYGVETIDLGAPGVLIYTSDINNTVFRKTGTSLAAPHVTGAIALMHAAANTGLTQYYESFPALGAQIFKSLVLGAVDTLTSLADYTVSGGRLNLHGAVLDASQWQSTRDGDLNDDGQVNVQDVIILVNLVNGDMEITPKLLLAGDIDYDGRLSSNDLTHISTLVLQ